MKKIASIVGRGKFLVLSLLAGLALFAGSQTETAAADAASIEAFQKIMDDPKVTTKINMTNTKDKKYYVAFCSYRVGTILKEEEFPISFSGHAFVCFATTDPDGKITGFETDGFEVDSTDPAWKQERGVSGVIVKLALMLKGVPGVVKQVKAPNLAKTDRMLVTEVNETQFNEAKKVLAEWDGAKNYALGKSDCAALAIDVAKKLKENKVKIVIPDREKYMKESEKDFDEVGNIIMSCKAEGKSMIVCPLPAILKGLNQTGYTQLTKKDQESVDRLFRFAAMGPGVPANWEFREKIENKKLTAKQEEELIKKIVSYPNTYMEYFCDANSK